jgi:hypothetical protein
VRQLQQNAPVRDPSGLLLRILSRASDRARWKYLWWSHNFTLHYTKAVRHVLAHWAAGLCRAFKGKSKIEYQMVWSKLTLLSLNVKEMSLQRAAAFSLQLCPFLNSTPKPPQTRPTTTPPTTSTRCFSRKCQCLPNSFAWLMVSACSL